MPNLQPITALRFTSENGDISTKIAPPYDVLDEQPKRALLEIDEHNIVEIDLPVTPPKTVGPDEAYENSGETLRQWIESDVLKRDGKPAVYAYEQQYTVNGQTFKRRGLFSGLEVEEFNRPNGGIWRHELTIKGGTDDRLKLMRATATQLSPIFGVFSDADGKVVDALGGCFDGREPDYFGTTDFDGVSHRCWVIDDTDRIAALQQFFEKTDVFIADGHHRYTTALNYSKENPDKPLAKNCLFVLVAMQDPGMIVQPYHRVLCGLGDMTIEAFIEAEAEKGQFHFKKYDGDLANIQALLKRVGYHAMALVERGSEQVWIMTMPENDPLIHIKPNHAECWRKLNSAVLQYFIVEQVLQSQFANEKITYKYTADVNEVVKITGEEVGRLGVIVQPTPLKSVCAVSYANEVMPAKSTYFYPKLATGMVINPLD